MSHNAAGLKTIVSSGREQRTDGLLRHLGTIDGGFVRVRNTLIPPAGSGSGLELQYDTVGRAGYVLTFDRDAPAYLDLNIVGKNVSISPSAGGTLTLNAPLSLPAGSITTAAIQGNAIQQSIGSYIAATTWSTTVVNTWIPTAVTLNATTAGGLLRIEMSAPVYHTIVGGSFYVGFMMDGSIQVALGYFNCPGQSYTMHFASTYYVAPAAGVHSFTIAVYNGTVGTVAINPAAAATLYVTEQKR